jgi:methyltransferase (TIGR00027 family)
MLQTTMAGTLRRTLAQSAMFAALTAIVVPAQSGQPSATALEVTAYRAIGARHPDPAIRNLDMLAERFLGEDGRTRLRQTGSDVVVAALQLPTEEAWLSLGNRRTFALAIHVRTRYIDTVVEEALMAGATQIVVLGAGMDSRAYRFAGVGSGVRAYELDLPQTQQYKKQRVTELLGSLPANVTYVPIDFARQDLEEVLTRSGYDAGKKTIFVWEGVTMYIPEAAVDATLRFVAKHAFSGSQIVFDGFPESRIRNPSPAAKELDARVAATGEPFVFGFPEDRGSFVAKRGLVVLSDVAMGEIAPGYLPKGNAFTIVGVNRIIKAAVP